MVARTRLSEHMPHAIEQSLKILGTNLRLARLRRNMSMDDLAAPLVGMFSQAFIPSGPATAALRPAPFRPRTGLPS